MSPVWQLGRGGRRVKTAPQDMETGVVVGRQTEPSLLDELRDERDGIYTWDRFQSTIAALSGSNMMAAGILATCLSTTARIKEANMSPVWQRTRRAPREDGD